MTVIYRKYRPSTFADLVGQEAVKKMITYQIKNQNFGHSYLFVGPRGIGKTTIARLFAKSLNCHNRKEGDFEPCNKCQSCIEVNRGNSIDIIEIDAASNTGVDNVREQIIENSRFTAQNKFKIFIIDEVHMLSKSAFNALLKTLEEPPEHVIFILATTEMERLPATVISRCQRMQFGKIPVELMRERLFKLAEAEGKSIDEESANMIFQASEGCLRDAESVLGQILSIADEKKIDHELTSKIIPITSTSKVIEVIFAGLECEVEKLKNILQEIADGGLSINHLKNQLIEIARDFLYWKLSKVKSEFINEEIERRLAIVSVKSLQVLIGNLLNIRSNSYSAIPQLEIELALLEICKNNDGDGFEQKKKVEQKEEGVFDEKMDKSSVIATKIHKGKVEKNEVVKIGGSEQEDGRGSEALVSSELERVQIEKDENEKVEKNEEDVAEVDEVVEKNDEAELDIDLIVQKWQRCCSALKKRSIALPLVASKARPIKLQNDVLIINFVELFNYETMNTPKNISLLEDSIEEILQVKLSVKIEYANEGKGELTQDLATAFGGAVI